MATRKIHFFTGKGGVGKSTLAAAFALKKAHQLKNKQPQEKILLTEATNQPCLQNIIQHKYDNLEVENWTAKDCLSDYASHLIKSKFLTQLFLNNNLSQSLIQIAPGLNELALLGKATAGPRNHGPQLNFSEIFMDSYSTGHFLQLMRAPEVFSEIFNIGPMATQSKSIDNCLKNTDLCQIFIVLTSDSLVLSESLELFETLKSFKFKPVFLLNKFLDFESLSYNKYPEKTKQYFKHLHQLQIEATQQLEKKSNFLFKVPFCFEMRPLNIVNQLIEKSDFIL